VKNKSAYLIAAGALAVASLAACGGVALFSAPGGQTESQQLPTALPQDVLNQADVQDQILVNLYERVSPSVVNVEVSAKDSSGQLQDVGLGSGFVYDMDGHIITNAHVEVQSDELRVKFEDGTVLTAKVVGDDKYSDLAVLKVDAPAGFSLTPLEIGDSSTLQVGERVMAIGNPFGLSNTMTTGIVSGIGRTLPSNLVTDTGAAFSNPLIIQIDAAINPGNSGGPLLDLHGRVVGVNVAIRSDTGVNAGVGFAIPSNTLTRVVPQIIQTGKVSYPYLGIATQSSFELGELSLAFHLPVSQGVLISDVPAGSPASKAGLRGSTHNDTLRGQPVALGGDIIVAVDRVPINNFDELLGYLVSNTSIGQRVVVTIIRDGQKMDVPVTLESRPAN
jgi:S1-C subfamily serine protease